MLNQESYNHHFSMQFMQLFPLLYEMIGTFYYVLIFCNVIIESIEYHLFRSYNNCRNIL